MAVLLPIEEVLERYMRATRSERYSARERLMIALAVGCWLLAKGLLVATAIETEGLNPKGQSLLAKRLPLLFHQPRQQNNKKNR